MLPLRPCRGRTAMSRVGTVLGAVTWPDQVGRLARWLNPVVASPGAPLETVAGLSAMGPSLMPRTSRLQGVSMGLSVLGARATTGVVERLTRTVVPAEAPIGRQLVARAAVGGAGMALPATLATSFAVTAVGSGLTRGYVLTRGALEGYFGPGPGKRLVARLVNAG